MSTVAAINTLTKKKTATSELTEKQLSGNQVHMDASTHHTIFCLVSVAINIIMCQPSSHWIRNFPCQLTCSIEHWARGQRGAPPSQRAPTVRLNLLMNYDITGDILSSNRQGSAFHVRGEQVEGELSFLWALAVKRPKLQGYVNNIWQRVRCTAVYRLAREVTMYGPVLKIDSSGSATGKLERGLTLYQITGRCRPGPILMLSPMRELQ